MAVAGLGRWEHGLYVSTFLYIDSWYMLNFHQLQFCRAYIEYFITFTGGIMMHCISIDVIVKLEIPRRIRVLSPTSNENNAVFVTQISNILTCSRISLNILFSFDCPEPSLAASWYISGINFRDSILVTQVYKIKDVNAQERTLIIQTRCWKGEGSLFDYFIWVYWESSPTKIPFHAHF